MYKLFTPSEWYSLFGTPSLFIEDDGLIYSENDYYRNFRTPIGKFDYASGFIYGSDYNQVFRREIGKIKNCGNVTEIYGEDYTSLWAQPILYIQNGEIFSQDPRSSGFPTRVGYIVGSTSGSGSNSSHSDRYHFDDDYSSSSSSDRKVNPILAVLLTIIQHPIATIVTILVLVAMGYCSYWAFTDSDFGSSSLLFIAIGGVVAFIFGQHWMHSIVLTCCTSTVLMFIYDFYDMFTTTPKDEISIIATIISVIAYPFVGVLAYGFPSVVIGGGAHLIKTLFFKKEKNETKK